MQLNSYKLNLAMARAGISAGELERKAELSNATIAKLRKCTQTGVRPQTIYRIANALGCDPANLIESEVKA